MCPRVSKLIELRESVSYKTAASRQLAALVVRFHKTLSGVERSIKAIQSRTQSRARNSHPGNEDLSNSQDDIDHTEDPLVIPAEKPNGLGNSTVKDGRAGNTSKTSNPPWTVEQELWLRNKIGKEWRLDRKSLTQEFKVRFGFSRTEMALVSRAHRLRKAQKKQ